MKIKFKIHPLYYVVMLICFITGYFKYFSLYTLALIIHEAGHIFAALVLKWKIDKVTLYPFGCMTTFNQKLNSSVIEEFFILLFGPLFQILFYMIYPTPYNLFILIFNLLPIYPLDGSKIYFLLLSIITSYYKAYIITFILSYVTIFILFIYDISFLSWLILIYIVYDLTKYVKSLKSIMLKFYYERYTYPFKYKRNNIIKGYHPKKMIKVKNNYFIINKQCYHEKEILNSFLT